MNSWKGSSQATNRGSMSMTSSWSRRADSGNRKIRWDRKKSQKSKSKIKVMLMGVFFWLAQNCAPRIRTWGSKCQHSFLRGGFEASERLCASRATRIVGGEAMDSPPWQCPCTLCINRAWVFGAQFHQCAWISPLFARFSPLRFFFVPQMQTGAAGMAFGNVMTIKSEMTSLLKGLREEEFQGCFHQWKRRWDKCIVSNGEYFEGDHFDVSENL